MNLTGPRTTYRTDFENCRLFVSRLQQIGARLLTAGKAIYKSIVRVVLLVHEFENGENLAR